MGIENSEVEFDISGAVETLGSELGYDSDDSADDVDLQVDSPAPTTTPADQVPAVDKPEGDAPAPDAKPDTTTDTPTTIAPPRTWRKEALAEWNTLSPTVQAEIAKREEDIFKGIEDYKQDANFGKTINSIISPYAKLMQANNIDPAAQISGLMQAHYTLAMGSPEQKLTFLQKLADDYGIALPGHEPAYVDPEVKNLQSKLQALESKLTTAEKAQLASQQQELNGQIEAFASNPKNEYFNDVVQDMAALLNAGAAKDLQDAYDKAVWANPTTRAKEMARQQAETSRKAEEEAKAKSAAAKKATATNVKTSTKNASAAAPLGSMDDTLQETFAAIKARS